MVTSITSVTDLLAVTNELRQEWNGEVWWRGQPSVAYLLVPGVYRIDRGVRAEQNLALRFRQYAQTRYDKCPLHDDFCSWLFLAQHYGLPTRLLDWSESPLVSLFFAVDANSELDASLYALHPREMNRIVNGDHTLVPVTSFPANELFRGAFDDRVELKKTIAILSHELDSRMLVQQSAFTLHGNSDDLLKLPELERVIRTFNVPAASKGNIIAELASLGIRRRTLFPDLDSLAKDLKDLVFSEIGIRIV
jgi:hypothetical protein